jgi:hypothetical protein
MIDCFELIIAMVAFLCYVAGVIIGAFIWRSGLKAGYRISESEKTGTPAFSDIDKDLPISQEETEVL